MAGKISSEKDFKLKMSALLTKAIDHKQKTPAQNIGCWILNCTSNNEL